MRDGSWCKARWIDCPRPEYVKHSLVRCEKIVRNDPAVAAPPYHFSAHHGTAPGAPQLPQLGEAQMETAAHRVVGIVVETLIFPIPVYAWWNVLRVRTSTSQLRNIFVSDVKARQCLRKCIAIVLRICP